MSVRLVVILGGRYVKYIHDPSRRMVQREEQLARQRPGTPAIDGGMVGNAARDNGDLPVPPPSQSTPPPADDAESMHVRRTPLKCCGSQLIAISQTLAQPGWLKLPL